MDGASPARVGSSAVFTVPHALANACRLPSRHAYGSLSARICPGVSLRECRPTRKHEGVTSRVLFVSSLLV